MDEPKQVLIGIADGIDIDAAIKDALSKAVAPGPGFDVQTYEVTKSYFVRGGIVGATTSHVTVHVYDGMLYNSSEIKPRFDSLDDDPMVKGGLSDKTIENLKAKGWELRKLIGDRHGVPVTFASQDTPSGIVIKYGTVPDGTIAIENDGLGQSIIVKCGNPCPILNKNHTVP